MKAALTLLLSFLLCAAVLPAQLTIDQSGRAGLAVDPLTDSQWSLENTEWSYGLHLKTVPNSNGNYYGIHNTVDSPVQMNSIGIYTNAYNSEGGSNHGLYNRAFHHGSGKNVGIMNYSRHYGSGEHIALHNLMWYSGSGDKTAIYNFLGDDSSANSGSNSSMYGTRTHLRCKYFPNVYGHHVRITNSGSSSSARNLFGIYVMTDGHSKNGNVYGVYSHVKQDADTGTGGSGNTDGNYAGYFTGTVVHNGSLIITSDERVKEDIDDVKGALAIVDKLHPTSYRFRKNNRFGHRSDQRSYGFLAQEVRQVVPELVVDVRHPQVMEYEEVAPPTPERAGKAGQRDSGPDSLAALLATPTATVAHAPETLQGVNYVELIPILTQAIKEQQALIEELRDGQAALRDELQQLRECTKCSGTGRRTPPDMKGIGGTSGNPSGSAIGLFPNPTTGGVTVSHPSLAEYHLHIVSGSGQSMVQQQVTNHSTYIDTQNWPAGTYTVFIQSDAGVGGQKLLIVN
jgi:hypothetical protein